jgi:hypothetical protein
VQQGPDSSSGSGSEDGFLESCQRCYAYCLALAPFESIYMRSVIEQCAQNGRLTLSAQRSLAKITTRTRQAYDCVDKAFTQYCNTAECHQSMRLELLCERGAQVCKQSAIEEANGGTFSLLPFSSVMCHEACRWSSNNTEYLLYASLVHRCLISGNTYTPPKGARKDFTYETADKCVKNYCFRPYETTQHAVDEAFQLFEDFKQNGKTVECSLCTIGRNRNDLENVLAICETCLQKGIEFVHSNF